MIKLTERQAEILAFIKSYAEETGYPPTRAEIAQKLGFKSANAAEDHLKALARKGVIEMVPGASRGIRMLQEDSTAEAGIPIVGKVAAGNPVLAIEHIEDYCQMPPEFFNPQADYFLRVTGLSMKNIGILDGDLLAVHSTNQARNGQVVVARIEDEVTVKRFQKNGSHITLIAENEDFSPIEVDLKTQVFAIEGIAVGVVRRGH